MVNKRFWLGIAALALVFGMTAVGCDNGGGSTSSTSTSSTSQTGGTDPALNGTWVLGDLEMTFNNGNFASASEKGTYTTNGNNITMTTTQIYNDHDGDRYCYPSIDEGWYTKAAIEALNPSPLTDEELNEIFTPSTASYSISGNELTFTFDGDNQSTFTKIN